MQGSSAVFCIARYFLRRIYPDRFKGSGRQSPLSFSIKLPCKRIYHIIFFQFCQGSRERPAAKNTLPNISAIHIEKKEFHIELPKDVRESWNETIDDEFRITKGSVYLDAAQESLDYVNTEAGVYHMGRSYAASVN